jgi:hypothetical protein
MMGFALAAVLAGKIRLSSSARNNHFFYYTTPDYTSRLKGEEAEKKLEGGNNGAHSSELFAYSRPDFCSSFFFYAAFWLLGILQTKERPFRLSGTAGYDGVFCVYYFLLVNRGSAKGFFVEWGMRRLFSYLFLRVDETENSMFLGLFVLHLISAYLL